MTGSNRESKEMSALRGSESGNHLTRGHGASDFVQDSLSRAGNQKGMRGSYITPNKAAAIIESLSDRDCQVVELLATVQLASGAQIRRLVWGESSPTARQARRQMGNLSGLRVIARHDQRVGGVRSGGEGYSYSLDVVGQQMTGITGNRRRPRPLGLPFMAHALAVTDCYLVLQEMDARRDIELVHFETEPQCWRDFSGPGGARLTLKPDAFAITAQGDFEDRWYLEIDRSTESPARLLRKAQAYIDYYRSGHEQASNDIFPRVLWVVPDENRLTQLVRTFEKLPAEYWKLFQVTTTDQFAATITAGAGEASEAES
jgi:hypothetical protein